MFRSYLSSAWGDLVRSPIQSLIAIGGLAIGLMAAIIAGLVTVDVFTLNDFVPGHDQLYLPIFEEHGAMGDLYGEGSAYNLAGYLRAFPGVQSVAREATQPAVLSHGAILAREDSVAWADPEFFRLYRVSALYGDLDHALDRPDGMVVTLALARKYFSRDDAVGQMLELNHKQMMTVRAVIPDWQDNRGEFPSVAFASSLSPNSVMSHDIGTVGMSRTGGLQLDMLTLVKLSPGASLDDLNRRATALMVSFAPSSLPERRGMHFERLDQLKMSPKVSPGNRGILYVMEMAALVVLALSIFNFVNLSIARSVQRGLEVAVRKALGAGRRALILQFLGESILQVLMALVVAVALVEWSLPAVNAFLETGAVLNYWRDPALDAVLLGGAGMVGILAGAYPALVLSGFRPAAVLKGWRGGTGKGALMRQGFVMLQFAALIVFLIAAVTVYQQNAFATREAMRVNTDQMLAIRMPQCMEGLRDRIAALPGVRGAACSSDLVLLQYTSNEDANPQKSDALVHVFLMPVGYGYLELMGLKPVAGRFFRAGMGDAVPPNPPADRLAHYVVNEAAVRQLGFANAQAAIGQMVNFLTPEQAGMGIEPKPGDPPVITALRGSIVGVVEDFALRPESFARMAPGKKIPPVAYSVGNAHVNQKAPDEILNVKLSGQNIPETLATIDDAWRKSGAVDPIQRFFLDAYIQAQELSTLRQGQAFGVFAGIAMLLACLGLFGVTLLITTRRIKEIGIRKAMGAESGDILRLFLWQFARPVLWANLLAWPVAFSAMRSWLVSFPYHIDLSLWLFPAAGAVALVIALLTVAGHAILVARQKPVTALRYE